jgi:hypothetical protein
MGELGFKTPNAIPAIVGNRIGEHISTAFTEGCDGGGHTHADEKKKQRSFIKNIHLYRKLD